MIHCLLHYKSVKIKILNVGVGFFLNGTKYYNFMKSSTHALCHKNIIFYSIYSIKKHLVYH